MKDSSFNLDEFQDMVSDILLRHRSILDIITKYQDSTARVNRAVVKSVTSCGCIQVHGEKQELPDDASLENMKNYMKTHLTGTLCDNCRDAIEKELGNHLFYLTSMANTLDISLSDIILSEKKDLSTLGKFNLK